MNKTRLFLGLLLAAILLAGCDEQKEKANTINQLKEEKMINDRSIYGLACQGCTDSVVVLLPADGSDPVHYDIIDAMHQHRVMGKPKIGDWVCIVPTPQDKHVAEFVVNLEQLKGTWCYVVMPKMRAYENMSKKLQARMMRDMPDSIKETYLIPREYGFTLQRQWTAQSVGYVSENSSLEEESPVVYPQLGFFTGWHVWNGKLIIYSGTPVLSEDKTSYDITDVRRDTCDIVFLNDDSLTLSSEGSSRTYYRRNNVNDINKKARAIAALRQKQALEKVTSK